MYADTQPILYVLGKIEIRVFEVGRLNTGMTNGSQVKT